MYGKERQSPYLLQEEAEAKAAAAERNARQLQLSLKQSETELQQQAADAQLDGHAATLRLSDVQHSYTRFPAPYSLQQKCSCHIPRSFCNSSVASSLNITLLLSMCSSIH